MQKIILFLTILSISVSADYQANISKITPEVKQRMINGNSYKEGCPVGIADLRYLRMKYKNFSGQEQWGELIVHKDVADEVVKIFKVLYELDYPIYQMRLVSDYKGSDWQSIEADNTSAFNCRKATGSKSWSKHSYGKAIDINPIENPYISRSGHISHKASLVYKKRVHKNDTAADKTVLLSKDKAVMLFKKHGWQWGGDWIGVKDYQHFSK
ncbi:M15 family metallopeptidase [Sulfurovum sp. zt1-1]|uniref:M15 family metallopeptidase n=1 Tax=Sulfurovum zhangzhouensis TaxID=3019067 RepID=A0ABT7R0W8_9BACT|nr:M15 family metallopeptidase [Sulfurovum zhangzhouensis]MDM5272725.1 M15 family metallopeptidase [Sulfurovum zhangzhouensis]